MSATGGVLSAYGGPNFLSRSLEDELRRLVARFGSDAVRTTAYAVTKKRRGPKRLPDWRELADEIGKDATDWLDGRDPMRERSNYSIAKAFAERQPGHSGPATHRRIMRKLRDHRQLFFLISAWNTSERDRPYGDYFRAVDALQRGFPSWRDTVAREADRYRGVLVRYEREIGMPDDTKSIADIESELDSRSPINALIEMGTSSQRGMFGVTRP